MINLASKFSPKVDEAITIGAYTEKNLNKDYEFTGVDTVKVYTIGTADIGDYTRSGSNRYGTPDDLEDTVQTMTLKQDSAFTYVIDKGDNTQQMMIKNSAKSLKRQTDEKIIPYLDKYRFAIMGEEVSPEMTDTTTLTKANIYEKFLEANEKLVSNGYSTGITCYIASKAYNLFHLDPSFTKTGDLSQKMVLKGQLGEVDGVPIVRVAGNRLPSGIDFILAHNKAMVSPKQLSDYKIHKDPPGISGDLVEGRFIFDAFILNSKKNALFVQGTRVADMTINVKAGTTGTTIITGMSVDVYKDEKVYVKSASSVTLPAVGTEFTTSGYTELSLDKQKRDNKATVTATAGHKVAVVIVDRNGNVRQGGTFTAL